MKFVASLLGTGLLGVGLNVFPVDVLGEEKGIVGGEKRNKLAGAVDLWHAEAMPGRSADLAGPNGVILTW